MFSEHREADADQTDLKVIFAFYTNKVDSKVIHRGYPGSFRQKEFLIRHNLLPEDEFEVFSKRVTSRAISKESGIVESLLDHNAIKDYYGVNQAKFALGLIQLERLEKSISVSPWYGDSIKIVINKN